MDKVKNVMDDFILSLKKTIEYFVNNKDNELDQN